MNMRFILLTSMLLGSGISTVSGDQQQEVICENKECICSNCTCVDCSCGQVNNSQE